MGHRGLLGACTLVRRAAMGLVVATVVLAASLTAFDRGYGAGDAQPCADACSDLAPAMANLVQAQEQRGLRCGTAPRLSGVVVVDDGSGGAAVSSLADVVASGRTTAGRTVVYCR